MSIWKDEKGSRSMARLLMLGACILLGFVVIADAAFSLPEGRDTTNLYAALSTLIVVLGAWAGGPRAMQHLGPVIGKITSRFGAGGGGVNRSVTMVVGDDPAKDDERA